MITQMYNYFEHHGLLVPTQFGFRRKKSSVLGVESLVDEIINYIELKLSTHVILCDQRWFDCIPYNVLLVKLEHCGLGETVSSRWFNHI